MSAITIARAIATELTRDVNSDRWTCAYEAALAAMAETQISLRDRLASNASEEDVSAHMFGTDNDWAERPRSREQARYAFADAMLAAKAMEARRATTGTGVVHDSAVPQGFAHPTGSIKGGDRG